MLTSSQTCDRNRNRNGDCDQLPNLCLFSTKCAKARCARCKQFVFKNLRRRPQWRATSPSHKKLTSLAGEPCIHRSSEVGFRSPLTESVHPNGSPRLNRIADGASNTILFAEKYSRCTSKQNVPYPNGGSFWAYSVTGYLAQPFHAGKSSANTNQVFALLCYLSRSLACREASIICRGTARAGATGITAGALCPCLVRSAGAGGTGRAATRLR
jgi:hypothetical protein